MLAVIIWSISCFAILLGLAALVYLIYEEQRRKQQMKEVLAPALGFQHKGHLGFKQLETDLAEVLKQHFGREGEALHFLEGSTKGVELSSFTYYYKIQLGRRGAHYYHTAVAIPAASPSSAPPFSIRPKTSWDSLNQWLGYEVVELPAGPGLVIQVEQNKTPSFDSIPADVWVKLTKEKWGIIHHGRWTILYLDNQEIEPTPTAYQTFLQSAIDLYLVFRQSHS